MTPAPAGLRIICAWCRKVMQDGRAPISHGICPECAERMEPTKGETAKS